MSTEEIYNFIEKEGGIFSVREEPYTSLLVCNQDILEDLLKAIISCTSLSKLFLGGSSIEDKDVAQLLSLQGLTWLELSDTEITDKAIEFCAGFNSLQNLYLFGTECTDKCIPSILKMENLKTIGIEDSKITVQGRQNLSENNLQLEIV
ncbi:MAG: leucine-rich repeat domain-containing protein [Deltaproteobacteria bacterium]|nr:leucine-rich repeat domain-containing protein [Deltaproteobacteria bacterium]